MFMREYDLSRMITILVGNLAYASDVEMLMLLFQNRDLSDILTRVNNVVPKSERPLKQDVALLAALLNEKLTASNAMTLLNHRRFESLMQYDFDWALTRWNTDRYPNGVQDLSPKIKLQIREGGKLTAMKKGDAQARTFHWKSSSDMTRLQWRWGDSKAGQFDDGIGASRIKTVAKQALSPWSQDLLQKGTIKTDGFLLLLGGLTQQERAPLEMVVKFKLRNQRDTLFEALSEWREAATFGF